MHWLTLIFGCRHAHAGGTVFRDAAGDLYRVCGDCSAHVPVRVKLPDAPPRFRSVLPRRDDEPRVQTALERIADEETARQWGIRMEDDR